MPTNTPRAQHLDSAVRPFNNPCEAGKLLVVRGAAHAGVALLTGELGTAELTLSLYHSLLQLGDFLR